MTDRITVMSQAEKEAMTIRFCRDALDIMQQAACGLPESDREKMVPAILAGGEFEVRCRLRSNRQPRIAVALIDPDGGEWLIAAAGGAAV